MKRGIVKIFIILLVIIQSCTNEYCELGQVYLEGVQIPNTEVFFPMGFYESTPSPPKISPDGKKLVYNGSSILIGEEGLWVMDLGNNNKNLLFSDGLNISPAWSPDGQWITFNHNWHIYKIKVNGDSLTQLTYESENFSPEWPGNNKIHYSSNKNSTSGLRFIWKMNNDGSEKIRIAYDPNKGEILDPSICYTKNMIIHLRYIGIDFPEIYCMDTIGLNPTRLTTNSYIEYVPQISPFGDRITFFDDRGIWIMNSDGSNLHCILPNHLYNPLYTGPINIHVSNPSWFPDGKHIIYRHFRITKSRKIDTKVEVEGYISLYKINIDSALVMNNLHFYP